VVEEGLTADEYQEMGPVDVQVARWCERSGYKFFTAATSHVYDVCDEDGMVVFAEAKTGVLDVDPRQLKEPLRGILWGRGRGIDHAVAVVVHPPSPPSA
jgi:hypothetical protein